VVRVRVSQLLYVCLYIIIIIITIIAWPDINIAQWFEEGNVARHIFLSGDFNSAAVIDY
jgi:hypothetical protein